MMLAMRLFTQRDIYYVEINGKRRSLRTKDKTVARRLYNQIKREYLKGKVHQLIGKCTVTLGQYRDEFLKWAEDVQPEKTFKANRLALNKLVHYGGENITLDRVNTKYVDQMIADCKKKGLRVNSINNYIRHARAALNKAVEWKYVRTNLLAAAKELPNERRDPKFLEQPDALKFLKGMEDVDLRRFATASIATGRRRSELFYLKWPRVDLERGIYYVKGKRDGGRWYHINSLFRAVLLSIGPQKEGRVFDKWEHPDTITHKIKEALVKAGYPELHLHCLRHTYASLKAMEGRSLKEIQELLGHTEIKTTQIYAHLTDDHLADIAEIALGPIDLGK
jgi:site-specific recombinase XerD